MLFFSALKLMLTQYAFIHLKEFAAHIMSFILLNPIVLESKRESTCLLAYPIYSNDEGNQKYALFDGFLLKTGADFVLKLYRAPKGV